MRRHAGEPAGASAGVQQAARFQQALRSRARPRASTGGPPMGRALFKSEASAANPPREIKEMAAMAKGNQRGPSHNRSGEAQIRAVRTQQGRADKECVHRVVPDQRCPDAPAQQDDSRDDADQADFDAANVGGLLRIVAVQKSPDERPEARRPGSATWSCAAKTESRRGGTGILRSSRRRCRWPAGRPRAPTC